MSHRIDRVALGEFINHQSDVLESTTVPADVAALATDRTEAGMTTEELRAIWLGAGLAVHVGLVLLEEPERFICSSTHAAK